MKQLLVMQTNSAPTWRQLFVMIQTLHIHEGNYCSWNKLLDHEAIIGHGNKLCTHIKATIVSWNNYWSWKHLLIMKHTLHTHECNYWSWNKLCTHMKQLLVSASCEWQTDTYLLTYLLACLACALTRANAPAGEQGLRNKTRDGDTNEISRLSKPILTLRMN